MPLPRGAAVAGHAASHLLCTLLCTFSTPPLGFAGDGGDGRWCGRGRALLTWQTCRLADMVDMPARRHARHARHGAIASASASMHAHACLFACDSFYARPESCSTLVVRKQTSCEACDSRRCEPSASTLVHITPLQGAALLGCMGGGVET